MTAKNIDDVAQTLAEYERLAITSGAKVQIDPPEFSNGETAFVGDGFAPYWLSETPPRVARATVHRDGVPTTVYASWDESLPIETAQTDDGRLWRDLWEKNPMQRFGSYVVRAALRRAFREVIGDRVEPDEDAPKVTAKDDAVPHDWDAEIADATNVVELDEAWTLMRLARARTGAREAAYKARRAELAAAEWEPAEGDPGAATAMTNAEYEVAPRRTGKTPQDHLPSNRAARRAAARKKGGKR